MPSAAHKNFFELFGLPATFDVDAAQLASRYRELAREVHPDRFASGSDAERRAAMQVTTSLNEALRVLKNPILRARYLLTLRGEPERSSMAVDPAFLIEQMELRENMEEARGDRARLEQLADEIDVRLREKEAVLRAQLAPNAPTQAALRTTEEMQFLDKLRQHIQDELE